MCFIDIPTILEKQKKWSYKTQTKSSVNSQKNDSNTVN